MTGGALDRSAADAFLEDLWDSTARALLAQRNEDAAALATEAEGWLHDNGVGVLGVDECARWVARFAASRRPNVRTDFEGGLDHNPTGGYRNVGFVGAIEPSPIQVHEVACTGALTRVAWSRAQTSPEQALADAHTELHDDLGTAYLALNSGGGSDAHGSYRAFSRFVPAIPPEATELQFRTGEQIVRMLRDVAAGHP